MAHTLERRAARSADAHIIVLWFPTKAEAVSWGGPSVPEPLTSTWLAREFEAGSYWVWVDSAGTIEGVFSLRFLAEGIARLSRFALAPSLRGQRLAKGLVEEIITLARSLGAKQLSLGVYGSNRIARHVYDDMGFQIFGERAAEEDSSGVSHQMRLRL
jgi:ribosomal protein S18 acetylase RimI-like enzyme